MTARRILVLFAHPALEKSRVNRVLLKHVENLDGVTVNDLYQRYPELDIDVGREQELLTTHDVIVFHHPLFWYSTPAILKEWQDLVLEHGWAYGQDGKALHGKLMFNAISTGGSEKAYHKKGYNRFSIQELLVPIEQTARLCGLDYLPPFTVHGTLGMTEAQIKEHARDYRRLLEALRDRRIDLAVCRSLPRLNIRMEAIITD